MRIWRIEDDGSVFWVELEGTDAELNEMRRWVTDRYDASRALVYRYNRTRRVHELRTRDPNQILLTTVVFFHAHDAVMFKLTWGGVAPEI